MNKIGHYLLAIWLILWAFVYLVHPPQYMLIGYVQVGLGILAGVCIVFDKEREL